MYPTSAELREHRPRLAQVADDVLGSALDAAIEITELACRRTFDRVTPASIRLAVEIIAEDLATKATSRVPDRATMVITDQGSYQLGRANPAAGRWTGIDTVDAILAAHRIDPLAIG